MKTLIVYDSAHGNTQKIAEAMGRVADAEVKQVHNTHVFELPNYDVVIVGSPVHGGRATFAIEEFLKKIPDESLIDTKVAAFDTRFAYEDHGLGLKVIMKIIRFAAERIANQLQEKGGTLVAEPEGFIVEDKQGPLKKGELERAAKWAKKVVGCE